MKENVLMEVLPPQTMRHIPSTGSICKGEGPGVEWQPSGEATATPRLFSRTFKNYEPRTMSDHLQAAHSATRPSDCDAVFGMCSPSKVPFAVQFKNYKYSK
jgi:hypothetical protein